MRLPNLRIFSIVLNAFRLSCLAGTTFVLARMTPAYSQSALLQAVTEDIAQASNRESGGNKGGPENNVLSHTIADQPVRAGKTAFRHWVSQRGERSELAMMRTEIGGTYWYGWSMQIPQAFDQLGHETIVMQLASDPSPRNGKFPCRANGPFMHIDAQGKLVLHLQHAGDSTDSVCEPFTILADITPVKGQWIDFVLNAKWTGEKDGFVNFWVKIGDHYTEKLAYRGRTWWNDEDQGPYFKMGAYLGDPNWGGPPDVALYTDEFRMGGEKSGFDEVAPPGPAVRMSVAGKGHILNLRYFSSLNQQDIPVKIYLPPGYATSTVRYPVVYNLHGGGGTPERQWDRIGKTLIDAMDNGGLLSNRVKPVIYVFVNGLGNSEFVNTANGKQIERSIVTELIPFIDKNYRTVPDRTGRAIEGFSMGGFGCLSVAFKNPDLFSSVVSYGAALVIGPKGENYRDAAHFDLHDPKALTVKNRAAILKNMRIRMVCGDSDWLFTSNIKFKNHLDSLKVPFEWVVVPGMAHCTKCLYEQVGFESLKFIEESFATSTKGKPMNTPGTWKKRPYPASVAKVTSFGNEPLPYRPSGALPRLKVSENKRYLVTEAGRPFFWLADTGWMLFQKLDREEVDKYFENRATQQFSVVLAHALPWQPGEKNVYGEVAFEGGDFMKPNASYWKHADYIVEQAAAKGLYLGLLPAWALNYIERKDGKHALDSATAYHYGKFLGNRYRKALHIIWVMGGDVVPTRHAIHNALAKGITDGTGGDPDGVLFTYHPPSRRPSSAGLYHDQPWLDFNLTQSGHDVWRLNYETTAANYALRPTKPTAEGEPCYENHPIRHKFENGVFKDFHMRMRAYWSLFAGGFGYTYGGNGIWQMDKKEEEPFLKTHVNRSWDEALTLPGAEQMRHVRALMESRPFLSRLPDDGSLLRSEKGEKDQRLEATFGGDRSWAMVYSTSGQNFQPDLSNLRGKTFNAWWFDPRTGKVCDAEGASTGKPFRQYTYADEIVVMNPPGQPGEGNDWVLVLDDAAKGYPVPGTSPGVGKGVSN